MSHPYNTRSKSAPAPVAPAPVAPAPTVEIFVKSLGGLTMVLDVSPDEPTASVRAKLGLGPDHRLVIYGKTLGESLPSVSDGTTVWAVANLPDNPPTVDLRSTPDRRPSREMPSTPDRRPSREMPSTPQKARPSVADARHGDIMRWIRASDAAGRIDLIYEIVRHPRHLPLLSEYLFEVHDRDGKKQTEKGVERALDAWKQFGRDEDHHTFFGQIRTVCALAL